MTVPPDPPPLDFLGDAAIRVDVLLRLAWTDGRVSRLTSAMAGLPLPADVIETDAGARYSYLPGLRQLPTLRQLMNGKSEEVEFGLSGLPSEIAAIADEEAGLGEGALIHAGKVYWADDWGVRLVRWTWRGTGGSIPTRREGGQLSGDALGASTWGVSIKAIGGQARRASASLIYMNDAQHRRLYPGDRFFSQQNKLHNGYAKPFPKF